MLCLLSNLLYALHGLAHALRHERSLRLFAGAYAMILAVGVAIGLTRWEWMAIILTGCIFIAVELLNTALERFVDVFDEYNRRHESGYHPHLKATKDTASAAALVSLLAVGAIVLLVFWPHLAPR